MSESLLLPPLPHAPEVLIECPRFSFVKRRADGSVDFVSPVPCPYNYGSIPGLMSGDGDPLDAVVLGARLSRGQCVRVEVVAVLGFVDSGLPDPKVICAAQPMSGLERAGLEAFFRVYAFFKRGLHLVRGHSTDTRFTGWLPVPRAAEATARPAP
ncbi:inorganic diphosphatase [Myxococcus landrumensis]|uniref:inorganic diphosphatase n=1 Tax=Myxococcus landrumensis TaxID=2813577 RepID=A0ABX7NDL0_9BACT|nr:inorganic diphosphatase [Myxococcus landrumus]QSQ16743.1 inorganic diphosphatase [Myxococcus landrumus]